MMDVADGKTSSVIVIVENHECFGLSDKLKLLFQWRKNGGSKVRNVRRIEANSFEIEFFEGREAVSKVCAHDWEIDGKKLKVGPNIQRSRRQSHAKDDVSSEDPNTSLSGSSKEVGMYESQYPHDLSMQQGYSNGSARRYKTFMENKKLISYLERFDPHVLSEANEGDKENWNARFRYGQEFESVCKKISFPNVWNYLIRSEEGQKMRKKVEDMCCCLITEGQDQETCGTNFKVTVLVTASIENLRIHLVQGSATDTNVDASLHFEDGDSENHGQQKSQSSTIYVRVKDLSHRLEDELKRFSNRDNSTLAISLSSKLSDKLSLDDFAKNLLQKLPEIFEGESIMHILLCETHSRALFYAYKYFLMKRANIQSFGRIDEHLWKDISPKNFSAKDLGKRITVVKSITHTLPRTCMVFLPISQNLDRSSCPYKILAPFIDLENSIKFLENKMTEEELSKFCVSSIHALCLPAHVQMKVHLYCAHDWTFDVAKSIHHSLHACLKVGSNASEVYIYPPGVFCDSSQYPVMFTVQKCLQALMTEGTMLAKISKLHLLVPEREYYEGFRTVLDSDSPYFSSYNPASINFWSEKKFDYKPESCLEVCGRKPNPERAFQLLVEELKYKRKKHSVKKELAANKFDLFKSHIQASSPDNVTITAAEKIVTISGLSKSVVDNFVEAHTRFFDEKSHLTHQCGNGNKDRKNSTGNPSGSREDAKFVWFHLNGNEKNRFSQEQSDELETKFQTGLAYTEIKRKTQKQRETLRVNFMEMELLKECSNSKSQRHALYPENLQRNEKIKDLDMKKGRNLKVNKDDKDCPPVQLLSKTNVQVEEIFWIDNERLTERFNYKCKSSSSLVRIKALWHAVKKDWAPNIACAGFQKLFSSSSQSGNLTHFSKDPTYFLQKGYPQVLLLCDVLYDDSSLCQNIKDHHIHLWSCKISDAHILPLYYVEVK